MTSIDVGTNPDWTEAILRQVRATGRRSDREIAALLGLEMQLLAGVDLDATVVSFLLGVGLAYGFDVTLTERQA